jgi:imidazole glycerol-phosphate synthase subunit HisH
LTEDNPAAEMIGIIDYGMGNIHSVRKALELMGGTVEVTADAKRLNDYAKLVLPGVGAFGDAMAELNRAGLSPAIKEYILSGKIFLGICLGMHLLFDSSEESPSARGLALVKGAVRKFPQVAGLKIPQMGWNTIRRENECPLLAGLPAESSVYFCHSFYPDPREKMIAAATTEHGVRFPSVIWKKNIYACQFHPEKSQTVGLAILKNFVKL